MTQDIESKKRKFQEMMDLAMGDDELSVYIRKKVSQLGILQSAGEEELAQAAHIRVVAETVCRMMKQDLYDTKWESGADFESILDRIDGIFQIVNRISEKIDGLRGLASDINGLLQQIKRMVSK